MFVSPQKAFSMKAEKVDNERRYASLQETETDTLKLSRLVIIHYIYVFSLWATILFVCEFQVRFSLQIVLLKPVASTVRELITE